MTTWFGYLFFIGIDAHVGIQRAPMTVPGLPAGAHPGHVELAFAFNYIAGLSYSFMREVRLSGFYLNLPALVALIALTRLDRLPRAARVVQPQVAV